MMDFLKITQKYFNRYINASELIEELEKLENNSILTLIQAIKDIIKNTNEAKDDLVEKELARIEKDIKQFEKIIKQSSNYPKEFEGYLEDLRKNRETPRDNAERWTKVSTTIKESDYYQKTLNALTDLELLELVSEDIRAQYPIEISEEKYNALVGAGIEQDKREWLWRLAFNYSDKPYDANKIANYFLDKSDCFYLTELIYIVGNKLNIGAILNKVKEKDPEFIKKFVEAKPVVEEYITDEQLRSLS